MPFLDQIASVTIQFQLFWLIPLAAALLILGVIIVVAVRRRLSNERVSQERASDAQQKDSQVAYLVSHEFPAPLQTILACLGNIANSPSHSEEWERNHTIALQETRRLSALVSYLRLLTSDQILRQPINIVGVIETALMKMGDRADAVGVTIGYEGPERLPPVLGNRDQLLRVIENMLDNGIKYRRQNIDDAQVTIRAAARDDCIHIEVADNGRGIAPNDLPHIFSPGFRSSESSVGRQGVGLGLAIVKHIIEEHHKGKMEVRSQLGEYTVFSFSLPASSSPGAQDFQQN
jgi:signal transduction histidine kinase